MLQDVLAGRPLEIDAIIGQLHAFAGPVGFEQHHLVGIDGHDAHALLNPSRGALEPVRV